jgi:hypothetical protein
VLGTHKTQPAVAPARRHTTVSRGGAPTFLG